MNQHRVETGESTTRDLETSDCASPEIRTQSSAAEFLDTTACYVPQGCVRSESAERFRIVGADACNRLAPGPFPEICALNLGESTPCSSEWRCNLGRLEKYAMAIARATSEHGESSSRTQSPAARSAATSFRAHPSWEGSPPRNLRSPRAPMPCPSRCTRGPRWLVPKSSFA